MRARLLLLALLASSCGSGKTDDAPRLLVVGWDGASYRMIDRLIAEGRLPNLSRLMDRGVSARLESTVIPISAAAWTAATTGKGPGHTGVYTFFEPVENSYDVRLVSARSNRAAPLWRILTWRGKRSIVFGVPLTYPPEPISGTLVAGMLSPFSADYAWPKEFTSELRARGFEPDLDVWIESRPVGWEDFEEQLDIKEQVLTELLGDRDWDFGMVVFKSLDVVSHLAYDEDFHEHVGPVYDRLDEALGALLDALPDDANVLVVSDHGFNVYGEGFNAHRFLVDSGFTVRKERFKDFDVDEREPFSVRERRIIQRLRSEIDWSRSRAFAGQSEGNFGAVRFNVRGREPEGIVEPADVDALAAEIRAALEGFATRDGRRIVTRVWRRDELYDGPHAGALPDLFFETEDTCQVFSDLHEEGVVGPYGIPIPDHDRIGILVAVGPSIRRATFEGERPLARITDLAPTALHLMNEVVPSEMTGVVLTELLGLETTPRYQSERDDPRAASAPRGGAEPFTPEELREIEARLGSLGYTD